MVGGGSGFWRGGKGGGTLKEDVPGTPREYAPDALKPATASEGSIPMARPHCCSSDVAALRQRSYSEHLYFCGMLKLSM